MWYGRVGTFKMKANRSLRGHGCEWEQAHRGVTDQATHPQNNRMSENSRFPLFSASLEGLYAQRLDGCSPSLRKYASVFQATKARDESPEELKQYNGWSLWVGPQHSIELSACSVAWHALLKCHEVPLHAWRVCAGSLFPLGCTPKMCSLWSCPPCSFPERPCFQNIKCA